MTDPKRQVARTARPGVAAMAMVGVALAVLGIALMLFAVPQGFVGGWGMAPEAASHFREALPWFDIVPPLPQRTFVWSLRILLVLAWIAWTTLVACAFRGATPRWSVVKTLAPLLSVALALFAPPALSRDVLGYVGYGRLPFLYGLNPYNHGRAALEAVGDSSAGFLVWETPLPYGPLWTIAATVMAGLGQSGGLYGELIAHKLVAALALLAAAAAGARLAEIREPGRGRLAFLAIAFNPLLLLEGPATGHNDFAMMALLLGGAALYASGRCRAGEFVVGLAIALKPVAVAVVPALLLETWLRSSTSRWRHTGIAVVLTAAPALVLSVAFGGPVLLLQSVFTRVGAGRSQVATGFVALAFVVALLWAWRLVISLHTRLPAAWLTAWIPVAGALILFATAKRFPWYVSWMLLPSLTGWDERHRIITVAASTIGLMLTWLYTAFP